ncbi:MAG: SdiA-regulated domain-containing protein [Bacteroidota bacterium]
MTLRYLNLCIAVFIFCSCNSHSDKKVNDQLSNKEKEEGVSYSYDLNQPLKKWNLPAPLKEISGQTWIDNDHLLAIEDLTPTLYLLRLDDTLTVEKTTLFNVAPDKKFDIEDVSKGENTIYALWSHGSVFKISDWETQPKSQEYSTELSKKNNTEGLCYDPVSQNLLIACKDESDVDEEKKSTRSIFEFDLKTNTLKPEPFLLIHKKDLKKFADEKLAFYPSAIAVHPITHDIYILSTKDTKCMARFSYNGELKSLQFIDKGLMPQPEGICFAPDGTLYISTEGRHGDQAAILKFAYSN